MGWPVFAENRGWRENREIDLFAKWPFSSLFARFFGHPSWKPFFLDFGLLSCGNTAVEVETRETLQKQGVSQRFRVSVPLRALFTCRKGFILGTHLEDNFFRVLLFCAVRCLKFCQHWVSKVRNPLGLQNRGRFQKAIFRSVSAARANLARGGARPCRFFPWISGPCQKCPRGCGAEGFSVFCGFFFFRPRFWKPQVVLFTSPSFSLCVFLFWLHSSWDWGQPHIARVFLGSWPSTLLIFWGFWGLLRKALFFPLNKGYLGSFLSVSLSFFLVSFTSLCHTHTHSLSLSLFLFPLLFFFFLVVLSLFLPSLFFLLFFLSCCFVFVSWEEQHQHITFESFLS